MRYLLIISVLFLTACQNIPKPEQAVIEYDSNQNVIRETSPVMSGKTYAELTIQRASVQSSENSRQECFKTNGLIPSDPVAQVAREVRLAAGKGIDCGTSGNDVEIAKSNDKVRIKESNNGLISDVVAGVGRVVLGKSAIDGAVSLGSAFIKGAGDTTTLNADNESSIAFTQKGTEINTDNGSTLNGAIGEGNTYTESTEGLLTNPADVVASVGTAEEVAEFEPVCTDLDGDGFVDGFTGTITVEQCES